MSLAAKAQNPEFICPLCDRASAEINTGERARCPDDGAWMVDPVVRARHPRDELLGKTVAGRYAIHGILGAGGMGAVYRATQMPVGREVALKVIRIQADQSEVVETRFRQEAQAISRLNHPSTVTLFDFGVEEDGTLFMALELVEGRTLAQRIRKGPLPYDRAAFIIACVLDALVEAHALGIVHRDLKPANIMLAQSPWGREQVKVLDFGIAKVIGQDTGGDEERLTKAGCVFGTPQYMSPEQTYDRPLDGRADIYAAGIVLYEALAGRLPFRKEAMVDLLLAHRHEDPPPLDRDLGVPAAVEAVMRKALEKETSDRWANAELMATALRTAAGLTIDDSGRLGTPGTPGSPGTAQDERRLTTPAALDAMLGPSGTPTARPPKRAATTMRPTERRTITGGAANLDLPDLGTSDFLSAEMIPTTGRRNVRRLPAAGLAIAAMVAGLSTAAVLLPARSSGPSAITARVIRPSTIPPRARAARADARGVEAWRRGDGVAADIAFAHAISADPTYAPAHYHSAAVHAIRGEADEAVAALEAHVEVDSDIERLVKRLEADSDFDSVRISPEYRSWEMIYGLRSPAPKAASRPKPIKRSRRRKRQFRKTISGGIEVPTF